MASLKDINYAILSRLIKNARTSDRQLAREIGVSQPTITRRRARLEKEGLLNYTTVPNFKKLGLEIMSFIFFTWKREAHEELLADDDYNRRIQSFFEKHPNLVFASSGQGLGPALDRYLGSEQQQGKCPEKTSEPVRCLTCRDYGLR